MSSEFLPIVGAIYVSFIYALSTHAYNPIVQQYSWPTISILRSGFALPLFIVWVFIDVELGAFFAVTWKSLSWLVLACFTTQGLADGLLLISCRTIGVPTVLTIAAIYPLWTALITILFKLDPERRLVFHHWCGLIITFIGIAGIVYAKNGKQQKGGVAEGPAVKRTNFKLTGYLSAFAVSLLWAISTFAITYGSQHLHNGVANSLRLGMALLIAPWLALLSGTPKRQLLIPLKTVCSLWWILLLGTTSFAVYISAMSHGPIVIISALSSLSTDCFLFY
ncbi:MAG: EamA family transporter [Oligoflexia bacterium]|nr:EamA family transporter [Oligoflexia bacterium]